MNSFWARAFFGSFLTSAVVLVIGLVTGIVTARVLGPDGRGILAIVTSWVGLTVAFSQFPISDALILTSSEHNIARERLNSAAVSLSIQINLVVTPIATIILYFVFRRYPDVPMGFALIYLIIALSGHIIGTVYRGILQADHKFHQLQFFTVCQPLVYSAIIFLLGLFGGEVEWFVAAQTLSILTVLLAYIYIVDTGQMIRGLRSIRKELFHRAAPIFSHSVIRVIGGQVDRILVVAIATVAEVGIYFIALTFAGLVSGILSTATKLMGLPVLMHFEGESRVAVASRLLKLTWIISIFGAIATAIVAPFTVPFLFGEAFRDSAVLASTIAFAVMFSAIRESFTEILKSCGANKQLLVSTLIYVASNVVMAPTLYHSGLGLEGIVVALGISNFITVVLLSEFTKRQMPQIRTCDWAVPAFDSIREIWSLAVSVFRKKDKSK